MASELKPCPIGIGGKRRHRSYVYSDGRQHYCERCGEKLDQTNFSNIPQDYVTTHDAGDYNKPRPAPAATDTGLETVAYQYKLKSNGHWDNLPSDWTADECKAYDKQETRELVTRSQAEAIIAAEREKTERWHKKAMDAGVIVHSDGTTSHPMRKERDDLKDENAALTARVKEWREESERKSEDWFDFCKAIGIEIDTHEAVADAINTARSNDGNEFKALETKLAATKKALERADEALQLGATEPGHTYVKIALGEVQS